MLNISKNLIQCLEASFNSEAKRICRDLSKILHVPEKELQTIVLKSKVKFNIIKDDTPFSCPVLIGSNLIERCRLPCILGTARCYKHQDIKVIPEPTTQKLLTRLQLQNTSDSLWCDESNGDVYNRNCEIVGSFKNSKLTLFTYS